MIFLHAPIVQRIISFLNIWDRTQHAPLVNKLWARIVKDPNTHKHQPIPNQPTRRMAWLVWKHVLEQNGKYEKLILKAIPYPCHRRQYANIIDNMCWNIRPKTIGMYFPSFEIALEMIPSYFNNRKIIDLGYHNTLLHEAINMFGNMPGNTHEHNLVCYMRIFLSWVDPKIWVDFCKSPFSHTQNSLKQVYERLIWALETNFGIVDIELGKNVRQIIENE